MIMKKFMSLRKAIELYSCNAGFSRILNKCLRDNNFDDIFGMRSFIRDLCDQLKNEHKEFISKNANDSSNHCLSWTDNRT